MMKTLGKDEMSRLIQNFRRAAQQIIVQSPLYHSSALLSSELVGFIKDEPILLSRLHSLFEYDNDLGLHNLRVGLYAAFIGYTYGLSSEALKSLFVGGLLHDYGKLQIDRAILNKPSDLDSHEWEIMRQHPAVGVFLTLDHGPVDMLSSHCILQHHERLDGSGYLGLKADQIHLFGRITAVADVFDAMTEDRSYRKGHPARVALQHLIDGAGAQYDKAIVNILQKIVQPGVPQKTAAAS